MLKQSDSRQDRGMRTPVPGTVLKEINWPGITNGHGSSLLAVLYQLGQTQWWNEEEIQRMQFAQLRIVLEHAYRTVPFYRERFDNTGIELPSILDMEVWRKLPILSRRDLQQQVLISNNIPRSHGKIYTTQTSGSTGEPVKLSGTELNQMFWRIFTLRDHEWHKRDFAGKLASIRATGEAFKPVSHPDWGPPVSLLYKSGTSASLTLTTDISKQMEWLVQYEPDYLLSFPSNLLALMEYSRVHGVKLHNLKEVRTISETVNVRLRQLCQQEWGVPLTDVYSSQEVGYIGLQCPDFPHLHVQSENVLVEILDDDGQPCRPGQTGRIIVSSLHNFATPLIRYELRDRAEAGDCCPCGRGLPVINRILGRERNMLSLPNGELRWPMTGYQQFEKITNVIHQFQYVQHTVDEVEVRLVVSRPLTHEETVALIAHIQSSLGHPFNVRFTFLDKIPRSRNGKFEDFISHVSATAS